MDMWEELGNMKKVIDPEVIKQRDLKIIELFLSGVSGTNLGNHFGITRERVSQIIFKKTGKSIEQHRLEQKINTAIEIVIREKICLFCHKKFRASKNQKFCSANCRQLFKNRILRQSYAMAKKIFNESSESREGVKNNV